MNRRMIATPSPNPAPLKKLATCLLVALACFAISANAYADKRAKFGRVQVSTPSGSYPLLLDGVPSGATNPNTPMVLDQLPPGNHKIEVLMPDGTRWTKDIVVEQGRLYCIGVTYKNIVRHCWDYPITANISANSKEGDLITFRSNVVYNGPSALNYTWTVSPATARITSGGAGSQDITVNTAGVNGPLKVLLVVDDDDGSGDPRCRQVAGTEMQLESCISTPITATIASQPYFTRGQKVTFSANTQYAGTRTLRYNWTVSPDTARIESGQGTPNITVDTAGLSNQRVTASLIIDDGSNDPACEARTETNASACYDCGPVYNVNGLKARLDNYAIELQNTPGATAQIYVSGPPKAVRAAAKNTRDYLVNTRGIDASRIRIEPVGGGGARVYEQLYIVPIGAPKPPVDLTPSPEPQGNVQPGPAPRRTPRTRHR